MAFEKFDKTGRTYKPTLSIWKKGQMVFSQGAVEKYKIREFSHVELYYDREAKKIGFKFVKDGKDPAIKKLMFRNTGAIFSAKGFLDYYGIDFSENKKYDFGYDEENGFYVVDLETEK